MFVLRCALASFRPSVRRSKNPLYIETSRLLQLLNLGSYARKVHVDGDARFVFIDERHHWFFTKRTTVPCSKIQQISYAYRAWPTAWNILGRVHDEVERFEIGLKLEGERTPLIVAHYWGEGAAGGFETWVTGDDLVDIEGTQADDSRQLVRHLTDILPVELHPAFGTKLA